MSKESKAVEIVIYPKRTEPENQHACSTVGTDGRCVWCGRQLWEPAHKVLA
jgi:hypothetical protein